MLGWRSGVVPLLLALGCGGATESPPSGAGQGRATAGATSSCNGTLTFSDPVVRAGVLRALGRSTGAVSAEEALLVTELVADGASSLDGIECLVNLRLLVAAQGRLSTLEPLAGLSRLERVTVLQNRIQSLSPLAGKPDLHSVAAADNLVEELTGLTLPPNPCSELDLIRNPVAAADVQSACAAGWWVAWGDGSTTGDSCNSVCLRHCDGDCG